MSLRFFTIHKVTGRVHHPHHHHRHQCAPRVLPPLVSACRCARLFPTSQSDSQANGRAQPTRGRQLPTRGAPPAAGPPAPRITHSRGRGTASPPLWLIPTTETTTTFTSHPAKNTTGAAGMIYDLSPAPFQEQSEITGSSKSSASDHFIWQGVSFYVATHKIKGGKMIFNIFNNGEKQAFELYISLHSAISSTQSRPEVVWGPKQNFIWKPPSS